MSMKVRKILPLSFALLLGSATATLALSIDYAFVSSHDYDTLGQDIHNAVGQRTWFFTHASVGGNMTSGLDSLHTLNSSRYQLTTPGASGTPPASTSPGSVYEYNRGNPGWQAKYNIFKSSVENGWGDNADFVMDKLCYIDENANADSYLAMMEDLDSRFDATFVYTTMPLTWGEDSDNVLRNLYNTKVRQYALIHDKLLFDIADLEAHDAAGAEQTFLRDGAYYQKLYAGWTEDGGHLDADGRVWIAKAWYALAASQENTAPVPEPASVLLIGTGLAGLLGLRGKNGKYRQKASDSLSRS